MTDESVDSKVVGEPPEKPKPSTQQEVNLAIMECLRHLSAYTLQVHHLAAVGAGATAGIAKANGEADKYKEIMDDVKEAGKAALRYHNAAIDLWEAFQKDAGDDLVPPRDTTRIQIDD